MLERTGAHGVMVARGAQGNPWIFREARALIDQGVVLPRPTPFERIDMARRHGDALIAFGGERAFVRMRKHVSWYLAEMPGAAYVRARVNRCANHAELDSLLVEYREYLKERM
jgi:tRNA-dihydrouridine synthase